MRLLPPALLASLLVFGPVSCKRTADGDTSGPSETKRRKRPPSMPKPLRLPRQPVAALHADNLRSALATGAAVTPQDDNPRTMISQALQGGGLALEQQLLPHVAISKAVDIAVVDGQTIVHVAVRPKHAGALQKMLAGKTPSGKFGAVELGRPPQGKGPKLAYFDKEALTLTLADNLRGIATGPELARAYGKKPLFLVVNKEEARKWGIELPAQSVEIKGQGATDFELVATGIPTDRPELKMVSDGALTGMLDFPEMAVGATTKYTDYQKVVNNTLGDAKRQVDKQNFLVKGVLNDLLGRARVVMRSWNGRILLGTGPRQHALIGLGTQDAKKAEQATLHLIAGITGNLKTARSFGISVPRVRLLRKWGNVNGVLIHTVTLERATSQVPQQYRQLLTPQGELKIAMAFSERAGGAMLVVGPTCAGTLKKWLEATANATPGRESLRHTAAARLAVTPEQLAAVGADQTGAAALGLQATRKPTRVVAERRDDRLKLTVKGPPLIAAAKQRKSGKKSKQRKPARRTPPA